MNALQSLKQTSQTTLTNREYLAIAIPLIISTLTTPLLGAVDTAVVGHLPDPVFIGGVAIGSLIFSQLYWVLGFLRVSTSGFTAQAKGANNSAELFYSFMRPLIIATILGILFVFLQSPIKNLAFTIFQGSEGVLTQATNYFDIRIWGAPFALINYVILGWLVGSANIRLAVFLQIGMNVVNIILDIIFVFYFDFGVKGVAFASLIAETSAVFIGFILLWRLRFFSGVKSSYSHIVEKSMFFRMIKVNRDLFIRTICLLTVYTMFTAKGAKMGEVELAANAILFQIHFIFAYFLGGFSNASSIFIGRAVGGKRKDLFEQAVKMSVKWGAFAAIVASVVLFLTSQWIFPLFTSIEEVLMVSDKYIIWLLLFPLVSFWGLQLYGIFSGATEGGPIRDSIILALIVFLLTYYIFIPTLGNHGLWLAFTLFSLGRTLFLWPYLGSLKKKLF